MKKLLIGLLIIVSCVWTVTYMNRENTQIKAKEIIGENYELIGNVGKCTLYKDTTQKIFLPALEKIGEVGKQVYYLPHIESQIYLVSCNGRNFTLKQALSEQLVTLPELKKALPKIIIMPKGE